MCIEDTITNKKTKKWSINDFVLFIPIFHLLSLIIYKLLKYNKVPFKNYVSQNSFMLFWVHAFFKRVHFH